MNTFLSNNKKLTLLIFVSTIIIIGIFLLTYFATPPSLSPNQIAPQPTKYILKDPISIPSFQKTIIGKTTNQEIEAIPGITKAPESNYSYSSYLITRPNEIKTENNTASFERVLLPVSSSDPNFTTIPQLIEKYGQPDKVVRGSKYYGDFLNTYIYATQGMAFVGNPNTNEVYEIQFFNPMTPDEYEKKYGQEILNSTESIKEIHGQ